MSGDTNWPACAVCWGKADVAVASSDFRRAYAVSASQSTLQILCHDGLQPNTIQDRRCTDISFLPEAKKKKKNAGDLGLNFTVAPRPMGLALASLEGIEYLLILLSSGHLLAANTVHLAVESLLATFEVSDDGAGPALAFLIGWAVVVAGSKLGLVDVAEGVSHGGGAKAFDLPKGMACCMVRALEDEMLAVGCSGGCLLLYTCAAAYKGQAQRLNLTLVVSLDISGAVQSKIPSSFRSSVSRMLGRDRGQRGGIGDAFLLPGEGLLVAAGSRAPENQLTVWQSNEDASGSRSRSQGARFLHLASASSTTKILRLVVVAGSHVGGGHIILSLDSFGDITLWSLRPLRALRSIQARCAFEVASARTFEFTGSSFMLIGTGSRSTAEVGWLDVPALLDEDFASPFNGRARTRRLPAPFGPGEHGGEIFFVSSSSLRCYKVSNGRSSTIPLSLEAEWTPLGILDERHVAGSTHLLVSALQVHQGALEEVVLIVSGEGEVLAKVAGRDACFTSSRVLWLTRSSMGETPWPHSGPMPRASKAAVGVQRLLGNPDADLVLLWGKMNGGPLHFEDGGPAAALPSAGPMELVDFRWDGQSSQQGCLALAAPFAIWVLAFQHGSGGWKAELLSWLNLRAVFCGRALSLAWLKVKDAESPGVLLFSTHCVVSAWAVEVSRPKVCAVSERPQLLGAAFLDRLISVELQAGNSLLYGPDQGSGGQLPSSTLMSSRPRARIRTRPISFFEVLSGLCPGRDGQWMKEVQWRLAPAQLAEELPADTAGQLWQALACAEAPPQLRDSPGALELVARAAAEEFRALAAILVGLSSRKGRPDDMATARLAAQVGDCVHGLRSSPARMPMLRCAATLLVRCVAGEDVEALAIASSVLAKYDLLPLGSLLAFARLYKARHSSCPLLASSYPTKVPPFHWSHALGARAPLAEALLGQLQSQRVDRDLSAAAFMQQPFTDTPAYRKPQACQLHTATLMQWLGLGSTQVQVRVFKAIQHEAEESPSSHEDSPGHQERDPTVLANGLLIYWRCSDGEGGHVRDSAGCGRSGTLRGGSWRQLSPDEPMEPTDEWGQALVPNFAISLQKAELRYAASSTTDRQMLSLLGGPRSEGELHLSKACEDGDAPIPGWTVELWARLGTAEDQLLFRRGNSGGLEWHYMSRIPAFTVTFNGKLCLSGPCDPPDDWVHLALRSNLQSIEVWMDGKLVQTSQEIQQIALEADLAFGPADLEITEVRLWGALRPESELLQYQRQCLDTLLPSELRGEAWKRVKIRAATAPPDSGAGSLPSLWDFSAPAGVGKREEPTAPEVSSSAVGHEVHGAVKAVQDPVEDPIDVSEVKSPQPVWPGPLPDLNDWALLKVAKEPTPTPTPKPDQGLNEGQKPLVEAVPHREPLPPLPTAPGRLMQGILSKRAAVEPISSLQGLDRTPPSTSPAVRQVYHAPPRKPPLKQAPLLLEVLPPLPAGPEYLSGADATMRVAVSALGRQAHSFAEALFKSVVLQLGRAGIAKTPAVQSRLEAAVSYSRISQLLRRIEERQSKAQAGKAAQQDLCEQWDCLLRLEKAPAHTVQLSVRAAAHLFHFAEAAGGWGAAQMICEALLDRYGAFLDSEQHDQVKYIAETTRHGLQAGRGGAWRSLACPSCKAPLDFLARACDACGAQPAVDFSSLKLCDFRHASSCSTCRAVFQGERRSCAPERIAGLPHSVPSSQCPLCRTGELRWGRPALSY